VKRHEIYPEGARDLCDLRCYRFGVWCPRRVSHHPVLYRLPGTGWLAEDEHPEDK
jgi:hypothetical protein